LNVGGSDMNWNIEDDTACDSPTDVDVTFDSTGMPADKSPLT
jgi:hypothetical protein